MCRARLVDGVEQDTRIPAAPLSEEVRRGGSLTHESDIDIRAGHEHISKLSAVAIRRIERGIADERDARTLRREPAQRGQSRLAEAVAVQLGRVDLQQAHPTAGGRAECVPVVDIGDRGAAERPGRSARRRTSRAVSLLVM